MHGIGPIWFIALLVILMIPFGMAPCFFLLYLLTDLVETHRLPRFSLRTLFVLATYAAFVCAYWMILVRIFW